MTSQHYLNFDLYVKWLVTHIFLATNKTFFVLVLRFSYDSAFLQIAISNNGLTAARMTDSLR